MLPSRCPGGGSACGTARRAGCCRRLPVARVPRTGTRYGVVVLTVEGGFWRNDEEPGELVVMSCQTFGPGTPSASMKALQVGRFPGWRPGCRIL